MAEKKASTDNWYTNMQLTTSPQIAMSRALGAAFLNHQVEQLEKTVNGPASGNWRDRKTTTNNNTSGTNRRGAQTTTTARGPGPQRKKGTGEVVGTRRSADEDRRDKDADVVVVDASVLIYALYQVKKWCRDGRQEILIVPLEALNTLDLLKKGTSSLAQKARAASRILEAQVGTNARIRVQRDDAFVLWDSISCEDAVKCPEWVRRIICCASWEVGHTATKVVLAVLSGAPNVSPQSVAMKLADDAPVLTPVPLPAPSAAHGNRFEQRSTGVLVSSWAAKAGLELLPVDPALPHSVRAGEVDDECGMGKPRSTPRGHRRPSASEHHAKPGLVERPPAVMAMMEIVSQPSKVVRVLARGEKLDPDP